MIIEYAGEVIRGSLTDMREKFYESKVGQVLQKLKINIKAA